MRATAISFSFSMGLIAMLAACGGGGGGTPATSGSGSTSYYATLNSASFSPSAVARGATLSVAWNASSNTPQNGYRIDFYLSADTTLDDDDAWMFGSNCWTGMEGFTGCGGNGDGSISGAVPSSLSPGQYYLLVVLSYYDGSFTEMFERYYLENMVAVN